MATGRWTPCAPPASARTAPRASLRFPPGLRAGGGPANTGNDEEGWLASKTRQFREHWADEMDGAAMYRALAERAAGEQREIFLELARAGERHAGHWAAKLVELGEPEPRPEEHRRGLKTRLVAFLARRFGPGAVLPLVERAEVVGAGISLLTGRSLAWSAGRQLLVGGLAAAATFGIGRLIGVSVS